MRYFANQVVSEDFANGFRNWFWGTSEQDQLFHGSKGLLFSFLHLFEGTEGSLKLKRTLAKTMNKGEDAFF